MKTTITIFILLVSIVLFATCKKDETTKPTSECFLKLNDDYREIDITDIELLKKITTENTPDRPRSKRYWLSDTSKTYKYFKNIAGLTNSSLAISIEVYSDIVNEGEFDFIDLSTLGTQSQYDFYKGKASLTLHFYLNSSYLFQANANSGGKLKIIREDGLYVLEFEKIKLSSGAKTFTCSGRIKLK